MKSDLLRNYLRAPRELIFAQALPDSPAEGDLVEFAVDVNLPQRPLHSIQEVEPIRVFFPPDDEKPQVFLLRRDFPSVPHLNQDLEEFPRQICLSEGSWVDERSGWGPGTFVERIRKWLSGTADGTLHRPDQPLEPILFTSPYKLVLPRSSAPTEKLCWSQSYFLESRGKSNASLYFVCSEEKIDGSKPHRVPVIFIKGPTTVHGLIHRFPKTLKDLEDMLNSLGASLVEAICAELVTLIEELKKPELSSERLIIVLQLPKKRVEEGPIEGLEHQAFLLHANVGELLKVDTDYQEEGGLFVPKSQEVIRDPKKLANIRLTPISVRWALNRKASAIFNGVPEFDGRVLAIGVGSLGSQVINHLHKSAFGIWTLVDDDIFEPHNSARHLLSSYAVGFKKADVVANYLEQVFGPEQPPVAITCNYLFPQEESERVVKALAEADLILDFSASIAVERTLSSDPRSESRRISVFLNQRGDDLVVLAEDKARHYPLDWLEAEYMRAVATDERLLGHFDESRVVAHRYGNSCRDLSSVLRQDIVAVHSGLASNRIRQCANSESASIGVFRLNSQTGAVSPVEVDIQKPLSTKIEEWRILVHPEVIAKAIRLREDKLPQETGGVMLGLVDKSLRFITILDLLPAPADSEEWPTSFIRGSLGLKNDVERILERTLGNVVYVGEWHTHPPKHNAKPSQTDWDAIGICSPHMEADGLPTMMLIAGHKGEIRIVVKPLGKLKGYAVVVTD